jgi:serine/threonine-protein kinase RsbW
MDPVYYVAHSRGRAIRRTPPFVCDRLQSRRPGRACMLTRGGSVLLQIHSNFDMVDFVQVISDRVGQIAGMDEDTVHWIGVAVRESVINAIKHGNREDAGKLVTVEFTFTPVSHPRELVVRVLDQGAGFDPDDVADPLEPENILKSSGRGIFFMRSFMDDVVLRRAAEGGMEVRMVKKLASGG